VHITKIRHVFWNELLFIDIPFSYTPIYTLPSVYYFNFFSSDVSIKSFSLLKPLFLTSECSFFSQHSLSLKEHPPPLLPSMSESALFILSSLRGMMMVDRILTPTLGVVAQIWVLGIGGRVVVQIWAFRCRSWGGGVDLSVIYKTRC